MPELVPFRALRYDASAVPDISALLCPPYDVISASERAVLAARDPRNAVHVELPQGDKARSPYDVAARTFAGWAADGALRRDDRPMVYVYEQRHTADDGTDRAARGFFCRLKLEPYGEGSGVLPHEHTMSGPKEDRFRLMNAVQANLSPVLFLYDDMAGGASADELITEITASPPEVDALGPGGLVNRLWLVDSDESSAAQSLLRLAAANPVTIADGHHRYETALRYRDDVGGGSSDQVLALMYEANSGGLALLPWHRLLIGADAPALLDAAKDWYVVEPGESKPAPGRIVLWTRAGAVSLTVDRAKVEPILPAAASESLRWLDVSVLSATLSQMIGTPAGQLSADGKLAYTSDSRAAVAEVEEGNADAAFLLAPTPIADVLAVARAGEHMPAKSTFFFPKAATGLVFNPLGD